MHVYELEKIIRGLSCSKSAGYDNIGPKLVKSVLPQILQPLLFRYNLSFSTGVVADALKIAKVVPIYKKDDPQSPCNYRLISLLSIFGKVLEKLLQKRYGVYLEKNITYLYFMIISLASENFMVLFFSLN